MGAKLHACGKLSAQVIGNCYWFHFNGVAIPRVVEFLYRRQLLARDWFSRRKALERIAAAARQENVTLPEKWVVARDRAILFEDEASLESRLEIELAALPANQCPELADQYAHIVHLQALAQACPDVKYESVLQRSVVEEIERKIAELQLDAIARTPRVETSWLLYELRSEGRRIGPKFATKTKAEAETFSALFTEALSDAAAQFKRGLRALQFLTPDPYLETAECATEEASLAGKTRMPDRATDTSVIDVGIWSEIAASMTPTDLPTARS
jgi:hypothetical protein